MKQAEEILKKFTSHKGVRGALLVSSDGFPLERVFTDSALYPDVVAAITRDAVNAARRMFVELDKGRFMQGIFEYTNGTVLFANLPNDAFLVIIAAKGCDKQEIWNAVAASFRDLMRVI